jgi:hypothetical protein
MKQYSAVYVWNGALRKIVFEAATTEEAQQLAAKWGFGLEGETVARISESVTPATPEAYDEETARKLLGNISRTTLYRLILRGKLNRVPAMRRVLVTRRSIERFCVQAA